jgi:hypothetical protein
MYLPLHLEPSLPDSADYVSLGEFFQAFNDFSVSVQTRIFKLERLQYYIETGNESWQEFEGGNVRRSLELMRNIRATEAQFDIDFFRRGLQFLRVRAIELPLSPYVEWELQSHIISAQYGETILVADLTNAQRNRILWNSRDFLLFDSNAALVHDYAPDGALRGGWISQDQDFLRRCTDLAAAFLSSSVPLAVFMANHPFQENPQPLAP